MYAAIKKRTDKKRLTPAQQQMQDWKNKPHTAIEDVDIRENTTSKLKFRKLPWSEWILATTSLLSALFVYCFIKVHVEPTQPM